MKKKSIIKLIIAAMSISLLIGCGNKVEETTETPQDDTAINASEEDELFNVDSETEDDNSNDSEETELADANSSEDDVERILNSNHFFVKVGDYVYFHMPDEKAMEKSALWGDFMMQDMGDSQFLKTKYSNLETSTIDDDSAWGKISLSDEYLLFQGKTYENDEPVDALLWYKEDDSYSSIPEMYDVQLLGSDVTNQYVYGMYRIGEEEATDECKEGCYIEAFHNEDVTDSVYVGNYPDYVASNENIVVYVQQFDDDENAYGLFRLDINTGDILFLGNLPQFDSGWGEVDHAEMIGEEVYLSYGNYDGTGHFYSGGKYIWANVNACESLDCVEPKGEKTDEELNESQAFVVKDGDVVLCDGIPNEAAVLNDNLGYYDENGSFVVVSNGYGRVYEDDYEFVKTVEIVEKIGDKLFLIRDEMRHISEEDVGWRYAYKRSLTEAVCVDIKTGKETVLASVESK